MNRGKGYQVLALMLLIAFLSLVTRTISLLVLSSTIAIILISLLGKDVKERQNAARQRVTEQENHNAKRKNVGLLIPIIFTLLGVFMAAYGITGLFKIETIFDNFGLMVDEPFVLISSIIIGLLLAIYGLTMAIKNWLSQ